MLACSREDLLGRKEDRGNVFCEWDAFRGMLTRVFDTVTVA
jgi:hypothetical protein